MSLARLTELESELAGLPPGKASRKKRQRLRRMIAGISTQDSHGAHAGAAIGIAASLKIDGLSCDRSETLENGDKDWITRGQTLAAVSADTSGPTHLKEVATHPCRSDPTVVSSSHEDEQSRTCLTLNRKYPNVWWRQIPLDHLLQHPNYVTLPDPRSLQAPTSPSDFKLYRQGTALWQSLHEGRVTTSVVAAALGIFDPRAGAVLGIPKSLCSSRKMPEAWRRVQAKSRQIDHLHNPDNRDDPRYVTATEDLSPLVWTLQDDEPYRYVYTPPPCRPPQGTRYTTIEDIRKEWGNVQEPVSVLAAINFFVPQGGRVEEVGLLPLEATRYANEIMARFPGLPLIGASPDAILRWPDGTVEVIEVKTHAPFAKDDSQRGRNKLPRFVVRDNGPFNRVALWHMPQLQLEMLCCGPECQSAVFMSCSATRGIEVFRVKRDKELGDMMLTFLARLTTEVSRGQQPPNIDLFWHDPAYHVMLRRLVRIGREVVHIATISPEDVQRSALCDKWFLD